MCCSVRRGGDVWQLDQDLHESSSSEPVPEVTTAPVLKSWLSMKELHFWLRELGGPIYGTKDVLFRRLCEWEHNAAKKQKEEE